MVDQVDGSGAGHEVEGGEEDEEGGADDSYDEVVLDLRPKVVEVF